MTTIRKIHFEPYREIPDLESRLTAIANLIAAIRDFQLPMDVKKRMLNHSVWEVTRALGDFAPEFRSKGVLEGSLGSKIERDHVNRRRKIIEDILAKNELIEDILPRIIHCVVTKDEHYRLTSLPFNLDGWARYGAAGIEVFRCRGEQQTQKFPMGNSHEKSKDGVLNDWQFDLHRGPNETEGKKLNAAGSEGQYILVAAPSVPPRGRQRQIVLDILLTANGRPMTILEITKLATEAGLKAVGGVGPSCRYHLHQMELLGLVKRVR